MFIYYGHYWNHSFYWIYFIITLWLAFDENCQSKLKQYMSVLLLIICFLHIFIPSLVKNGYLYLTQKDDAVKMAKIILNDENIEDNSIIVGNDSYLPHILLPYNKHKLINYCEDRPFDYYMVNYPANNNLCYEKDISNIFLNEYYTYFDKDRIMDLFNNNNNDYIYSVVPINSDAFKMSNTTYIKDDKTGEFYSIQRYKCIKNIKQEDLCLYKIKKNK